MPGDELPAPTTPETGPAAVVPTAATTTLASDEATGPAPALMLVIGALIGVLAGLGAAYAIWHTS